jgi:hypothetical protein
MSSLGVDRCDCSRNRNDGRGRCMSGLVRMEDRVTIKRRPHLRLKVALLEIVLVTVLILPRGCVEAMIV